MFKVLAMTVALAVSVIAADIRTISRGELYYIFRWTESNELVRVTYVDRTLNRVKVMYANGETDWASPTELLTRGESRQADLAYGIGVAAVTACLLLPDECRNAVSNSEVTIVKEHLFCD